LCPKFVSWHSQQLKTQDQELRVKASTKFIERIAKHTDRWDLVKELSKKG
jgi:hypothetical protein